MSRFNTRNPLGSNDPRDLDDNAKNMDLAMNSDDPRWIDRFGRNRKSFAGMESDFDSAQDERTDRFNEFIASRGYQFIGDYAPGIEITEYNQVLRGPDGEFWRISGKVDLPYVTTGGGLPEEGSLVPVGDAYLRGDLEDPSKGASLLARGVVSVNSVTDLEKLPDSMRRQDLSYIVRGYRLGSDAGGGVFYYDPERADENDGGMVINGFVRIVDGNPITPDMFGAFADGINDDTDALLRTFKFGKPIYLGGSSKHYRITSEISFIATSSVIVHSSGARMLVDSPESIRSAVRIDLAGNGLYVTGKWYLDCNLKSYSGVQAMNIGPTVAESDILASGLRISNCMRAGTEFTGGDGLFCSGRLGQVLIDDVVVDTVRMAVGAGIVGSQGVSGIVVSRDNANRWDARHVNITNCSVMRIYSDDPSYTADQDGIKVFTSYNSDGDVPRPVFASIRGCYFLNCHGRAIKLQTEFGEVDGIKIDRTPEIRSGHIGNPDIDFQVGGGTIRGVSAYYRANYPSRLVNFSLTRSPSRLNPVSIDISGVNVMQVGSGSGIDRVIAIGSAYSSEIFANISGVSLEGAKIPANFLTVQGADTTGWIGVNISGAKVRATDSVVRRIGVATPAWITGTSIMSSGAVIPFALATTQGDFNVTLLGSNRLVS